MKKIISICLLVLTVVSVASCSPDSADISADSSADESSAAESSTSDTDETESEKTLFAMDTYMTFKAYGDNADTALEEVLTLISTLEEELSVTNEESEIFKINESSGEIVAVSQETAELICAAMEISEQTDGAFDISIYPIMKEWGFTTGEYQVPDDETIQSLLEYVDYTQIVVDEENLTVTVSDGMQIDLGGIAKGYAGRMAALSLKAAGVESALLNMGGNVQTVGTKPDGSLWTVGIQDPDDSTKCVGYVKVSDKAIVTSGGYERYFEDDDGKIWWHIMNPATGYPADSGLVSVTIIGDDGMVCDALSTSLFVMGLENAAEYWREYGGFEAVFVTSSGEIYITQGLEDNFVTMDDYTDAEVNVIES